MIHTKRFYLCVGGNHFEFRGQIKVILIEKHETYIDQLKIMQIQKSCNNL